MKTLAFPSVAAFAALSFFLFSCGPGATSDGADGEATAALATDETADEVLTVVNSLFQAMQARDSTRIRMTLHPDAVFTSVNLTGDAPAIRRVEGEAFASSVGQPGPAYIERMMDPQVEHAGDFAHVWTYYDFHIADSLSHCGHDAIQLVRNPSGAWRILGITYTRTACE